MINKEKIILEFKLKPFGQKGWLKGDLVCPVCEKGDKFAVLFNEKGAVVHCFYCSISQSLRSVLKSIGREELMGQDYIYSEQKVLSPLHREKQRITENEEVKLPIGFKRVNDLSYLWDRGFTEAQFEQFKVGIANSDPRTKNKVIFLIYQKGEIAGWMARSQLSKEWHHENLKRHKEYGDPLVLRYRNSNNDFSKMLGGLDEITEDTHTLILVEGLFDKANLDRLMGLNDFKEIKCCYTFGSDLNISQIDLIPRTVDTIILMYDKGTINSMKDAGGRLMSLFNVKVALIKDKDIDPGNMDKNYLAQLFLNLQEFIYFYSALK